MKGQQAFGEVTHALMRKHHPYRPGHLGANANVNVFVFVRFRSFSVVFVCSFVYSFVYSFVCLFVRSFIRLFVHSFIHLFGYSFVFFLVYSFIRSFVRSFIRSFVRSVPGAHLCPAKSVVATPTMIAPRLGRLGWVRKAVADRKRVPEGYSYANSSLGPLESTRKDSE